MDYNGVTESYLQQCESGLRMEGFGAEWDENTWTKRLVYGLQFISIPNCEIHNTTTISREFKTSVMKIVSCLLAAFFLFNGSPDVLLKKRLVYTMVGRLFHKLNSLTRL